MVKAFERKHIYGPKTPGLLIRKKKSFLGKHIYLGINRLISGIFIIQKQNILLNWVK